MNWQDPYTLIGLAGVLLVLMAIWRTSVGKWSHHSVIYELDTIFGAALLLVYQYHHKAYIVMPINIAYVYVSFRGLSSFAERYAKRKKYKIEKKQLRQKRKASKRR